MNGAQRWSKRLYIFLLKAFGTWYSKAFFVVLVGGYLLKLSIVNCQFYYCINPKILIFIGFKALFIIKLVII